MALSDHPARAVQKSTPNKKLYNAGNQWWSDNQKLEAVKTYLMLGNVSMTSSLLKIPDDTLRRWRRMQWWKDLEGELRIQDDLMLSARLQKIVAKSFEAVEDRLENGDWVYDQKTGNLKRKHVSMKDAHKVAVDLMDKREAILNRQQPVVSEQQVDQKLANLAERFASMVNKKIDENRTVDIQDVSEIAQGEQPSFQDGDDQEEFDNSDNSDIPLHDETQDSSDGRAEGS